MNNLYKVLFSILLLLFVCPAVIAGGGGAGGGIPVEFTKLNLTLHEGSISTKENFNSLKPGLYEFNVENKTSEKIVFVIQDLKTDKVLGKVKIKPNKIKKSRVKITENGFKFNTPNNIQHEYNVN